MISWDWLNSNSGAVNAILVAIPVETRCKASAFPPRLGSLRLPQLPQPRRRIYLQTINPVGRLFLRCQSDAISVRTLYPWYEPNGSR